MTINQAYNCGTPKSRICPMSPLVISLLALPVYDYAYDYDFWDYRNMKNAYLINGIRTPVGKFRGSLAGVRADDMAALVIKKLLERNPGVNPGEIEGVILGCANQAVEDNRNVARMAGLFAGLPVDVPGETVNRLCASGMSAVVTASGAIQTGNGDLFIAGGVDNMTRAPMVISKSDKSCGGNCRGFC